MSQNLTRMLLEAWEAGAAADSTERPNPGAEEFARWLTGQLRTTTTTAVDNVDGTD